MACSCYEYVRKFEHSHVLLPHCWIVVRLDGRNFSHFSKVHEFSKPSDDRSLKLMTACALEVMNQNSDILLAYGHSDEYSFVFKKDCKLWNRREEKFISTVSSLFASTFVFQWPNFFPTVQMRYPPTFDARTVCYPSNETLKDYLAWRQVDCHVNNQFNYCFWSLVQQGGLTPAEAYKELQGSTTAFKNEMLFSRFGINYNTLPVLHRKGTTLLRKTSEIKKPKRLGGKEKAKESSSSMEKKKFDSDIQSPVDELTHCCHFSKPLENQRMGERCRVQWSSNHGIDSIETLHADIIRTEFWDSYQFILS